MNLPAIAIGITAVSVLCGMGMVLLAIFTGKDAAAIKHITRHAAWHVAASLAIGALVLLGLHWWQGVAP